VLPVFQWLAQAGRIAEREMLRTFNCGIGLVVIAEAKRAEIVAGALNAAGEQVIRLGEVAAGEGEPRVNFLDKLKLG
jgi:phosphoribosylformylglycinamidine cyclo-ligase